MGILDRFTDIIKANINDLLDRAEDPAKMIDQYMRELTDNLAEVKQETAAVMAEEARASAPSTPTRPRSTSTTTWPAVPSRPATRAMPAPSWPRSSRWWQRPTRCA